MRYAVDKAARVSKTRLNLRDTARKTVFEFRPCFYQVGFRALIQ